MPQPSTNRLAIFPLDHVLLPGVPLPLHIFEPRYRQMLSDITTSEPGAATFGIVHAQNSIAQTGTAVHAEIGTVAEILERMPYEDGSFDLLTVGVRRFRILHLDDESKPYLQADVEWFDDVDGGASAELVARARSLTGTYLQKLQRIGAPGRSEDDADDEPIPADALRASYEITARLQLTMPERQELLAAESVAHRLRLAVASLRRESMLMDRTRTIPIHPQVLKIVPTPN